MSGRVVDGSTIAGRPRIAAGSPIDVGGMGGGRGFRFGEKIAGIGRTRRHGWSLQRGRASSENHRYPMDEGASRVSENVLLPLFGFLEPGWHTERTRVYDNLSTASLCRSGGYTCCICASASVPVRFPTPPRPFFATRFPRSRHL